MHPKDLRIPDRLQRFPKWKGYPIHYTVFVEPDGTPNFRSMDENRRINAFENNLCHLCGWKLKAGPYAFIGGPMCVEAHRFVDGPMHIECAEYAARACPFLNSPTGRYSKFAESNAGQYDQDSQHVVYDSVANVRPARMGLVVAKGYTWGRTDGVYGSGKGMSHAIDPNPAGQIVCTVGEYIRVDWDIMPKSKESSMKVYIMRYPGDPPAVVTEMTHAEFIKKHPRAPVTESEYVGGVRVRHGVVREMGFDEVICDLCSAHIKPDDKVVELNHQNKVFRGHCLACAQEGWYPYCTEVTGDEKTMILAQPERAWMRG